MHYGEQILRGISRELDMIKEGTEYDYYLKPLKREQAMAMLDYTGKMREENDKLHKFYEESAVMMEKYALAMACLEQIAASKFPNSAAKGDLLQQMAADSLSQIEKK